MVKILVNQKEYEVKEGLTLMQACDSIGVQIPRFCNHNKLSVSGSCRMCLVEVKGERKPVASCAVNVRENMEVFTESETVKGIRKDTIELLLINHPLDCPICDQGGECDLQDQSVKYGFYKSNFKDEKRSVEEKNLGPLIKTAMTRCIQCTRCIRFLDEIAGTNELGGINRGDRLEISNYIENALTSELSGNLVDVCPVGALTNAQFAFKARSWELSSTYSLDVMDATGSNIALHHKDEQVLRVVPRINEEVNEYFVADKARYTVDALNIQRLDKPYIKQRGRLVKSSWKDAFATIHQKMEEKGLQSIHAIAGEFANVETLKAMKDFLDTLGNNKYDYREEESFLDNSSRANYLFNSSIQGIEKADYCLIVASNVRKDSPIINARIRKQYLNKGLKVAFLGTEGTDLTYKYNYLGSNTKALKEILQGSHEVCKDLEKAKNPMIIVGQSVYKKTNGASILQTLVEIANKYGVITEHKNFFNTLHTKASHVGALEVGFVNNGASNRGLIQDIKTKGAEILWLLGADNIDRESIPKNAFIIYQGHHGDEMALNADVVLPQACFHEQDGVYVNTEGRAQEAFKAVNPVGNAKEGFKIIKAFALYCGYDLEYNTRQELINKLAEENQVFANLNTLVFAKTPVKLKENQDIMKETELLNNLHDYYQTNLISRLSETMAQCYIEITKQQQKV